MSFSPWGGTPYLAYSVQYLATDVLYNDYFTRKMLRTKEVIFTKSRDNTKRNQTRIKTFIEIENNINEKYISAKILNMYNFVRYVFAVTLSFNIFRDRSLCCACHATSVLKPAWVMQFFYRKSVTSPVLIGHNVLSLSPNYDLLLCLLCQAV